jgi:hypothetical protein
MELRSHVVSVVLATSVLSGGCASHRALREDTVAVLPIEDSTARSVAYRAALAVMVREGYSPLHAAEPEGFAVYHEPLHPDQDGEACEDVRLDASFETGDDRATLAFVPCLVESKATLFEENGLEICIPQTEWREASCIDSAIARLKLAWRQQAESMATKGAGTRGPRAAVPRPRPFTNAALDGTGSGAGAAGACMKDTECKGDRICEAGRCADPARP